MDLASLAALVTAFCWALSGLFAIYPVQQLGALAFNRLRMQIVFVVLLLITLLTGSWRTLDSSHIAALLLSGAVGILLSDSFLYVALHRLGPRRNAVLFSTHAPMTALLGFFILDERLNAIAIAGIALVVIGVIFAILFGQRRSRKHLWEKVRGSLAIGIIIALCAALCHSVSALIVRPVMSAGVDPVAASTVRVSAAVLAFTLAGFIPSWRGKPNISWRILAQSAASGLVGMGVGMTCLMFALAYGKTGLVATLSSVTPVMILPLLWILTKERPAAGAWFGALLAVAGIACIINH
ncbi:MAG: DMT family transporter [Burkholderiales bacterium]|jgi:drug/metabolite transporter (DMT)-like permease|nr:DMT family transporter [Burkholderiales bacterium]